MFSVLMVNLLPLGARAKSNGDSNMWGFEGPPNLSQSVKILKHCLKVVQSIRANMENMSSGEHYSHLTELLNISLKGYETGSQDHFTCVRN